MNKFLFLSVFSGLFFACDSPKPNNYKQIHNSTDIELLRKDLGLTKRQLQEISDALAQRNNEVEQCNIECKQVLNQRDKALVEKEMQLKECRIIEQNFFDAKKDTQRYQILSEQLKKQHHTSLNEIRSRAENAETKASEEEIKLQVLLLELESYKEINLKLENKINKLKNKRDTVKDGHYQEIEALTNLTHDLQANIDDTQLKIKELESKNLEQEKKVRKITQEDQNIINKLKKHLNEKKTELSLVQKERDEFKEKIIELNKRLNTLSSDAQMAQRKNIELIKTHQEELQKLEDKNKELQKLYNIKESSWQLSIQEIANIKQKLNTAIKHAERSEEKNILLSKEIDDKIKILEDEHKNIINNNQKEFKEEENNWLLKIAVIEKQYKELQEQKEGLEEKLSFYEFYSPSEQILKESYNNEILEDSWCEIPPVPEKSEQTLITYAKQDNKVIFGLNPILSESNYNILLKLNDLSYAIAKTLTVTINHKLLLIHDRINKLSQELQSKGWSNIIQIKGKTGYNNNSDDITCIISDNKEENLIVVAFHGSRSGSMFKGLFYNDGHGDWGANNDCQVVAANEFLRNFPPSVKIHRGYANNLQSAQDELLSNLDTILRSYGDKKPWILFTGHSKGGAMASIAIALAKVHIKDKALLGAVIFSSPRAYNEDASKDWVHQILHSKLNIIKINVEGDIAPLVPSRKSGFRSIGMLALDNSDLIYQRIQKLNLNNPSYWPSRYFGVLHYGLERDGGLGFETDIVLSHKELLEAIQRGQEHVGEVGMLTNSMIVH
jgi:hypothetical protein